MGSLIDLTGQTYGEWTVIERQPTNYRGLAATWLCQCSCGVQKTVLGQNLRHGTSKSCGCKSPRRLIDLTGKVFGEWTVIERRGSEERGRDRRRLPVWLCRCSCGEEKVLTGQILRGNKSGSCGHWKQGSYITQSGYRMISTIDHPNAQKKGCILEHIAVMTEKLGRPLVAGETVHHKNLQRADNHPDNLELWYSPQPKGARVEDLINYVITHHLDDIIDKVNKLQQRAPM